MRGGDLCGRPRLFTAKPVLFVGLDSSTIKGVSRFMNLLERVLTLLRANLNAVVEKSDDPEKTLRRLQLDMRNQLMQVKTQVATAISESRKLQARAGEKRSEANTWYKKAENAVQHTNESAAR